MTTPSGEAPKNRPKLTREEMDQRNFKIMALFMAGNSEREIGRTVGVTGQRVNQIIKAEMKNAARHHRLLTDEALGVYVTRLETLLKATWVKAMKQDLKAIDTARRLMEQQARLYDLEGDRLPGLPALSDQMLGDDSPVQVDELTKYRMRHRRRPEPEADDGS